ncbi:MAG: hypothetical protein Q9178_003548 [Gyalolechia marmorata]
MFQDLLLGRGRTGRGTLGGLDPVSWDGDGGERPDGKAAQAEWTRSATQANAGWLEEDGAVAEEMTETADVVDDLF